MANETINLNPIKFGHGVAKSMASAIKQNLEYYMPFTSESIGNVAETAFDIAGFISENRPDKNSRNDSNIVKSFANRTARAAKTLLHDVTYGDLDFTETRNSMIKYINKHSHDEFAFDFDDGEFDSDEDNDFEGESSFTVEDFAEGMYESTTATIGAVEASTRTLAKTTVRSNAVLGDRLISNNMANMAQMMQMGNAINTNISGINANLASLVEYNNNTMNGFIENTVKHFNKVESFMDEVLKRYNRADEDEKRKKEIEANRRKEAVFDGLHINIGNAARKAIESLDAELGNSGIITGTAGLLLSILGGGNTPKWFQGAGDASTISQWIQIINPTKLLADAFLPNLKQAGQLDKLMKGAMASFKKKLTADKDNGGFFSADSFLGRLFGSIFGDDDFRFGKRYENKEASWMTSDSKALQLIPNKIDETQNLIQKLTRVTENIEEILAHSMTNALDLNKYVLNFNKDMLAFHRDMLDNNGNPPSDGGGGGGRRVASINRITQRNDVLDYHRRRNYNVTKEMTRRRIQNKHDYEDLEFDKLVYDEKQGRMVSSSEMLADYYAKKQSALGIRDFSAEIEDLISKHGSIELSNYDLKEANEKLADLIDAINSGDIDYFDDDGNLDADTILKELNDNVLEGLDDLQISGLYAAKFIGWLYEKNEDMKKKSAAFQDEVMSNPAILSLLKDINPKFNPYDITDMDDVKAILSEDFSGNNAQYAQIARTLTKDQKRSMRSRAKYANAELGKSREASERLATYSNVISAFESGRMKLFDDANIQSDWKQYLQDHYNTTDVFTAFERGGREFENMLDAKAAKEIKKAIQTKEAMSEGSKYQKQSYKTQKLSRNPINWAFGALNDTLTDILSDVFTDFNDGEYKKAGKGILGIFSSRTLTNVANAYGDRKITYTPGYDDDGNPVAVKIYDLKEHPGEVLIVRADGYDEGWEPDPYFEKVVRYNAKHGGYEWDEERQLFLDKDGKRSDLQYNPYVRPDLRVFEDSDNELEGHAQGAMRIDRDKVVQVHEGEMILDASLSDKVRDNFAEMIKAGGFTSLDHRAQKELIESISQSGDQFKGREMEVINTINNEINRHNIQNISSADLSKGSPVFIKTDTDDTLYTSFIKKTHEMAANIAILAGAKIEEFAEKREEKEQEKANGMGKTLKDKLIGSKGENGELTGGYFSEHINGIKSGFSDGVIKPMKDKMLANALVIAKNEGMSELETEEFLKNCESLIDGFPKGVAGGLVGLVMGGPLVGLLGGLFASNKVVRELVFGKIVKDDGGRHTVVGGMFGEFTSKLAKVGDDMVFNFKDAFREVGGNLKTGFSLFVKHITNGVNDTITENINDFFEQVNGSKEKKSFLAELFAGIKKAAYNVADTASDVAMDALSIGSKLVFNTAKIPFNMVAGLLGGKDYRAAKREQRRSRIKSIYDELVANDARMGIRDITPGLIRAGKATKDFFLQPIRPAYGLGVDFMAMDKGWKEQSMLYKASNAISTGAGKVKAGAKSAVDKLVSGVERLNESFGGNFLKNIMQAIGGTIIPIGASILTGNPLPAIIGLPLVAGNTVFKQAIGTGIISAALAAIKKLPRVAKTRTTGIRTFFRNRGHAVKQALGINDDKYYLKTMHDSTAMQGAKMLGDLGIDPEEYMRLKNATDLTPEEWNKLAEYDDAIKSGWNLNDKARYNELKQQQADFEAASLRKKYGGLNKEQYDRLQELNKKVDSGKATEAERAERDRYIKTMEDYDAGADIELINNWQANAAANKREMFEKGWNSRDNFKANNPGFYKNRIKALNSMMDNPFSIAASKFNNELRDLTVEDVQKMYPELSKEQAESIVHQYKNERFDLRKQIKHKFGNLDQFTFEEHSDEIREMLANSDTIGKSKAALANASDAELRSFILGGQTTTVEEDFRNDLLTNVTTITKLLDGTAPQFMDNLRQLVGLSPKHEEKDNSKYAALHEDEDANEEAGSFESHTGGENMAGRAYGATQFSLADSNLAGKSASGQLMLDHEAYSAVDAKRYMMRKYGVNFDNLSDPEYRLSLEPSVLKRAEAIKKFKDEAFAASDALRNSTPKGPVDYSDLIPELGVTPHAEGVLNIAKNEIAQLHAGEAVLDAETAKSFRSGLFGGMSDAKESIADIFSDMKSGIGELVGVFKGDKTASGDAKKSFIDQMKESFDNVGTKMSNAVFGSGLIPIDPKTGKPDIAKIGARLIALLGGAILLAPIAKKVAEKLMPLFQPIFSSLVTTIGNGICDLVDLPHGSNGLVILQKIGSGLWQGWNKFWNEIGGMAYDLTAAGAANAGYLADSSVVDAINNSDEYFANYADKTKDISTGASGVTVPPTGPYTPEQLKAKHTNENTLGKDKAVTKKADIVFKAAISNYAFVLKDILAKLNRGNKISFTDVGKHTHIGIYGSGSVLGALGGAVTGAVTGALSTKIPYKTLVVPKLRSDEKEFITEINNTMGDPKTPEYMKKYADATSKLVYSLTAIKISVKVRDNDYVFTVEKSRDDDIKYVSELTAATDRINKRVAYLTRAEIEFLRTSDDVLYATEDLSADTVRDHLLYDTGELGIGIQQIGNWWDGLWTNDDETSAGGGIGYGYTQNDPRWANMGYGRFRSGKNSTMGSGGCGPTAMANTYRNLTGRNINPAQMARFAQANGYNAQGGTSAGLFTSGARKLGLTSSAISRNGSAIGRSIRRGNNVIIAGKNGPYTRAGHIMSVRGVDSGGNAIVDDPLKRGARRIPMNSLTKGMTHAWSIGNGEGTGAEGQPYSYWDNEFTDGTITFNPNGGAFGFTNGLKVGCVYNSFVNAYLNSLLANGQSFSELAQSISPLKLSQLYPGIVSSGGGLYRDKVYNALNEYFKDKAMGRPEFDLYDNTDGKSINGSAEIFSLIYENLKAGNPIVFGSLNGRSDKMIDIISGTASGHGTNDPEHTVMLAGLYTDSSGNEHVVVDNNNTGRANPNDASKSNQVRKVPLDYFKTAVTDAKGYDIRRIIIFNRNGVRKGINLEEKFNNLRKASLDTTNPYANKYREEFMSIFGFEPEKYNSYQDYIKATSPAQSGAAGSVSGSANGYATSTGSNTTTITDLREATDFSNFADWASELISRLATFGSNLIGTFLTGDTSGLFNASSSGGGGYSGGNHGGGGFGGTIAASPAIIVDSAYVAGVIKSAYEHYNNDTMNGAIKDCLGAEYKINSENFKKLTNKLDTYQKICGAIAASDNYKKNVSRTIPEIYTWALALSVCKYVNATGVPSDVLYYRSNADAATIYNKISKFKFPGTYVGTSIDGYTPPMSSLAMYNLLPDWARTGLNEIHLHGNPGIPDFENAINYSAAVTPIGETSTQFPPRNFAELERMYFHIYNDGSLPSFGRSGFHFGKNGGYPGDAVFAKLMNHPDPDVVKDATDYYNYVRGIITSGQSMPSGSITGSKDFLDALIQAEDAANIELKSYYFNQIHKANSGITDPRIYALGGDLLCIAPAKSTLLTGVNDLDRARAALHGVADWAGPRADGVYGLLTSGSGTINGSTWNMAPYSLGYGDAGYNMRDNIHMYTDDVYMGDADHPMHVTMDHTSVTSRLDKLVELVDTALNGKPEPVAGTSNAKTLGMGKGETKPTQQISSSKGYSSLGQQDKLSQIHNRIARRTRVGTNYNQM